MDQNSRQPNPSINVRKRSFDQPTPEQRFGQAGGEQSQTPGASAADRRLGPLGNNSQTDSNRPSAAVTPVSSSGGFRIPTGRSLFALLILLFLLLLVVWAVVKIFLSGSILNLDEGGFDFTNKQSEPAVERPSF